MNRLLHNSSFLPRIGRPVRTTEFLFIFSLRELTSPDVEFPLRGRRIIENGGIMRIGDREVLKTHHKNFDREVIKTQSRTEKS